MTHIHAVLERAGLVGTLSAATLAIGSSTAYAHPVLEASTPPGGATVPTAPSVLLFDYDQRVVAGEQSLIGPGGQSLPVDPPSVSADVVSQALPAVSQPGEYTLAFRVRGEDGDVVTETFRFTLAPTAPPEQPPPTAGEDPPTDDPPVSADEAPRPAAPVHPLLLGFLVATTLLLGGFGAGILVLAILANFSGGAGS